MFRRVVIGAAVACLMGVSAYAQEGAVEEGLGQEDAVENSECAQQLTSAQEAVQDKVDANALSEADAEQIYLLLDEADALCTEGNGAGASEKLAAVNKLVGKGN
jgi:hypothetical protein